MCAEEKFPERPESHVIGEQALRAFLYKIKPEWSREESEKDYGWDVLLRRYPPKTVHLVIRDSA